MTDNTKKNVLVYIEITNNKVENVSKEIISYVNDNFDKKRVNVINPHYTALPCKPLFGLWASPVEPTYRSWEEWCRGEDFCLSHLEKYFTFTLSDDAKVLEVRQPSDISKYANDTIHRFITCIDFNKIIEYLLINILN